MELTDYMERYLIDRFGPLPDETANLMKIVETKLNCRKACIAKLDVGADHRFVLVREGEHVGGPIMASVAAIQVACFRCADEDRGTHADREPDERLGEQRDWRELGRRGQIRHRDGL